MSVKLTEKIYNDYCLVNYLYWEISGKRLDCNNCPLNCERKKERDSNG